MGRTSALLYTFQWRPYFWVYPLNLKLSIYHMYLMYCSFFVLINKNIFNTDPIFANILQTIRSTSFRIEQIFCIIQLLSAVCSGKKITYPWPPPPDDAPGASDWRLKYGDSMLSWRRCSRPSCVLTQPLYQSRPSIVSLRVPVLQSGHGYYDRARGPPMGLPGSSVT